MTRPRTCPRHDTRLPDRRHCSPSRRARSPSARLARRGPGPPPVPDESGRPSPTSWSRSATRPATRWRRLRFPSPIVTPDEANNTVHGEYFRPKGGGKRPAVVVLHILGADFALSRYYAARLADRGVAALFLKLPYYGERRQGERPSGSSRLDVARSTLAMRQGVCDIRRAFGLAGEPAGGRPGQARRDRDQPGRDHLGAGRGGRPLDQSGGVPPGRRGTRRDPLGDGRARGPPIPQAMARLGPDPGGPEGDHPAARPAHLCRPARRQEES